MRVRDLSIPPRTIAITSILVIVTFLATLVMFDVDPRGWFGRSGAQRHNPFVDTGLYGASDSLARTAADSATGPDAEIVRRVAEVPTAIWLTPEVSGLDAIEHRAATIAEAAAEEDAVAVVVLYGITGRDCAGGHSAGGLEPGDYRTWVERASRGLGHAPGHVAAVLEPDALAMVDECPDPDTRFDLLDHARSALDRSDVTTYLDAGHSDWVAAETMADRLRRIGIDEARGFSVNVAAYNGEADEIDYAERLADLLDDGVHYVMDTGRSGAGASDEWCNPPGRALGQRPGAGEGRLDARLWIKPPGESDGTCRGGPPAGTWWNDRAAELARAAGW
ncbi:glycoside hydrolase family 6 protein [Aeromicrobium sp. PE09-221]|uniref:glycoside hydrolase family 6 protein n=1 Tax=Aeromicrobium sp. PE09-221 TaxID=1898043 RepID=UPI0011211182|nr:glycoside hydrolase family 6 protein [Aeromicrobium sp. PE09-221]